ncbi:MAG: hypothetical protein AB8H80_17650 [Planctomycetota bacterium]
MIQARTLTKLASAIALLGIVLRVLLPALHTHGHAHGHVHGHGIAANEHSVTAFAAATCSCGVAHASAAEESSQAREGESADAAGEAHFCLACAIEEGTPADQPTAPDLQIARSHPGMRGMRATGVVFAASLVRLPAPRAPPRSEG